jgi:F-type H+-transporting ATPase subunit epsilon
MRQFVYKLKSYKLQPMKLNLEITTPEKIVLKEDVTSVTIPTAEGEITVLPNHIGLVGLVSPGALVVRNDGMEKYFAVSGGALEVLPGSRVVILADSADRAEDLVIEEIEKAKTRAQAAASEAKDRDNIAYADAAIALEREMARLKVAHRHRSRGNTPESN